MASLSHLLKIHESCKSITDIISGDSIRVVLILRHNAEWAARLSVLTRLSPKKKENILNLRTYIKTILNKYGIVRTR